MLSRPPAAVVAVLTLVLCTVSLEGACAKPIIASGPSDNAIWQLASMSAVSVEVAWAAGGSGVIVRTDDGGAHWRRLADAATEPRQRPFSSGTAGAPHGGLIGSPP